MVVVPANIQDEFHQIKYANCDVEVTSQDFDGWRIVTDRVCLNLGGSERAFGDNVC